MSSERQKTRDRLLDFLSSDQTIYFYNPFTDASIKTILKKYNYNEEDFWINLIQNIKLYESLKDFLIINNETEENDFIIDNNDDRIFNI